MAVVQPVVQPACCVEFVAAEAAGVEGVRVAQALEVQEEEVPVLLARVWVTEAVELRVYQYPQATVTTT